MSTLQVDRIEPYQSASVTIVGLDVDTTALNNFTASQEAINTNLQLATASLESSVTNLNGFTASQETLNGTLATTGSNSFVGNQVVSGDITATRLTLTGGAGNDLIVTGSALFTSTVQSPAGMQAGSTNVSYLNNQFIGIITNATSDEIGITADPAGYGVAGWTNGPALYLNDPGDTYPTVIGFQNKASWTDGTVSILKPLVISGSVQVSGSVTSTFPAPAQNVEIPFVNVNGSAISDKNYDRVFFGMADYPSFGDNYADYFAIEYYDSLSYNFGSEFNVNGKQTNIQTLASGSGQTSYVRTTDNYDGTSQVSIGSGNKVAIAGRAELSNVMQLAAQDPLPAGAVGELAVSGSNLYFYTDQWREVAFV